MKVIIIHAIIESIGNEAVELSSVSGASIRAEGKGMHPNRGAGNFAGFYNGRI